LDIPLQSFLGTDTFDEEEEDECATLFFLDVVVHVF
jgi:hypothetical protein